ncbi:hypothetical protein GCM10017621_11850 [Maricaulis virginensis]|uniref:Uncharacterized protein n=2 Tax=Maricaulis virginensis TaxID=144022 RepID=A0A9W6IJW4_9PROT|nr:hypothetical protein GCM10017621_11850 [Maricaulis virginensis]
MEKALTMKRHMIVSASLAAALFAGPAMADDHTGDVTLELQSISAMNQTGQPDPSRDADCQSTYGDWIGQSVTTEYRIDPQSMMMSANSTVQGTAVDLFPLGIQGIYAFMSDGVPAALEEQHVFRVMFQISMGYDHPESRVMTTLDDTTNCLIES